MNDGPVFVCWSGGKPPKEPRVKCAVCGRRWSTLLCDGRKPGPIRSHNVKGATYTQEAPLTCDAPLCEACATRPETQPLRLPDHRDAPYMNGMHVLQTERRLGLLRTAGKPRRAALRAEVPPETTDFCPACAANGGRVPPPGTP